MPRVNTVNNSYKPQGNCGGCGKAIEKGDPYRWWKFRHGGRQVRCMDCVIRPSMLTNSKMGLIWDAQTDFANAVGNLEWNSDCAESSQGAYAEAMNNFAEVVREVGEEYEESANNMVEGFGHETYKSEEIQEKADELKGWADEIESAAMDVESVTLDEETCDECDGTGEIEPDDEDDSPDTCEACNGTGNVSDYDRFQQDISDYGDIVENCPV